MLFSYAAELRAEFPELVVTALTVTGLTAAPSCNVPASRFVERALGRIAPAAESELPEIQAWRRAFAKLGLKPTQYRCASGALLRRLRKEGNLPSVNPLVDLCNAISVAYAIPIAAFDLGKLTGNLQVRFATGAEVYTAFSGDIEHPDVGEVIFADDDGRAHARRWVNRQSGYSAVGHETSGALIVAEALHQTAKRDIEQLRQELRATLAQLWPASSTHSLAVA